MTSETIEKFIKVLEAVEAHGKDKYGEVDWKRFEQDGREDNMCSIMRHLGEMSRNSEVVDYESGLHPGSHAAFRCLMQVVYDNE